MTGAHLFAALGIEVNKIRLLARHSREAIMRYVAEAHLRSFRACLGLQPSGSAMPSAFANAAVSFATRLKLKSMEAAIARLECFMKRARTRTCFNYIGGLIVTRGCFYTEFRHRHDSASQNYRR